MWISYEFLKFNSIFSWEINLPGNNKTFTEKNKAWTHMSRWCAIQRPTHAAHTVSAVLKRQLTVEIEINGWDSTATVHGPNGPMNTGRWFRDGGLGLEGRSEWSERPNWSGPFVPGQRLRSIGTFGVVRTAQLIWAVDLRSNGPQWTKFKSPPGRERKWAGPTCQWQRL